MRTDNIHGAVRGKVAADIVNWSDWGVFEEIPGGLAYLAKSEGMLVPT